MGDLVIGLGGGRHAGGRPRELHGCAGHPGQHHGFRVTGSGTLSTTITDNDTATWSITAPRA